MVCYRIPVFLLLNVVFCSVSGSSEKETNRQSVEDLRYDLETNEPMFGDADPEPTPSDCSEGSTCGFLIYNDPTGENLHKFTHYCHCPDGLECVREGRNIELGYFYFKCRNITELFSYESSFDSDPDLTQNRSGRPSSEVPTQRENARNLKRFGYVNEEL